MPASETRADQRLHRQRLHGERGAIDCRNAAAPAQAPGITLVAASSAVAGAEGEHETGIPQIERPHHGNAHAVAAACHGGAR
jgi:hypothetical protein